MIISLQWLKDYVTIGIPAEKLAHRLTMAGMEVEKIDQVEGDTVFELEITPNRPDCLNMLGLAREVSAVLNRELKRPKLKKVHFPPQKCPIEILDRDGCARYIGTVIRDVEVKPSPEWMQKRLLAVGLRPINNIVDITNFCLLETGQPLHAFDIDTLEGGRIVVRRARKGETIVMIDGEKRELDSSMLVIADAKRPVAVAGVMGGQDTEVTAKTKNIILESAYFDPIMIRRTARVLGVSTDSSYRFERGVDIHSVETGALRALNLILKFAKGKVSARTDLFLSRRKTTPKKITISKDQIDQLLGADLTVTRCKTILKKLGFSVTVVQKKNLQVTPPTFRNDVKQPVDLIEEVARVLGFDNLPMSLPKIAAVNVAPDEKLKFKNGLRDSLVAQGLSETVNYTLIGQAALDRCGMSDLKSVAVKNPLTQDQALTRPAMLPSMMSAARNNFNRGQRNLKLFEMGKTYFADGEKDIIAILLTGRQADSWRSEAAAALNYYDLKGVVERLLDDAGAGPLAAVQGEQKFFEPGVSAVLKQGNKTIGEMGQISDEVCAQWDIKHAKVFYAQVQVDKVFDQGQTFRPFKALCDFPSVVRDISLAVPEATHFSAIKEKAVALGGSILTSVELLELYTGDKIPDGQRGLVVSLVYQSSQRTLTEEEVNAVHSRICDEIVKDLGATIR